MASTQATSWLDTIIIHSKEISEILRYSWLKLSTEEFLLASFKVLVNEVKKMNKEKEARM